MTGSFETLMPPFFGRLSDTEIRGLVKHLLLRITCAYRDYRILPKQNQNLIKEGWLQQVRTYWDQIRLVTDTYVAKTTTFQHAMDDPS
jgi:hypothetical protein